MNTELLSKLISTPTPSGHEQDAVNIINGYLSGVASISTDSLGNIYARLPGCGSETSVLLEAHIDNVGFQVSYVDDNGFIYVRPLGGVDILSSIGQKVEVRSHTGKKYTGFIGKKPIHEQKADKRKIVPDAENIWIDVPTSDYEIKDNVRVGDSVVFISSLFRQNNRLVGFGLDVKAGVAVIGEVLKRIVAMPQHCAVTAAFSTQEEVGCKGAQVAVANTCPSIAISIDVCHATDAPEMSKRKNGDVWLGYGVVVMMNTDTTPSLAQKVIGLSKYAEINIQLSAGSRATGGTDAPRLQLAGKGISTITLGIPNRYMHTAVEMCDERDLDSAVDLIVELVKQCNII